MLDKNDKELTNFNVWSTNIMRCWNIGQIFLNKNRSWNKKLIHAWKCKIQPSSAKLTNYVFHKESEIDVTGVAKKLVKYVVHLSKKE